jgi:hypothetical protein
MTEDQLDLLLEAWDSVAAARLLLESGYQAQEQIARAEQFLEAAEQLLGPIPAGDHEEGN